MMISLLGVFPLDVILPSFPDLATSFDVSLKSIAFSVSIFAIGVAISQAIIGPLSDVVGRKPLLIGGLAVSVIGSLGCVFSKGYESFMIFRLIQAVGCGSFVLSQVLVQDVYPEKQQHVLRILMLTLSGLLISLSPLAGAVLQHYLGWEGSFYIFSILAVIVLLMSLLILPEQSVQSVQPVRGGMLVNLGKLVADRGFLVGCALCSLAFSCHFVFIVVSPLLLIGVLGLDEFMFGVVFVGYGVAYVIGGLVARKLADILPLHTQIGFGLAMIGFAGLVLFVWQLVEELSVSSLMVPVAIGTIGVAIIRPSATSYALRRHSERAGVATSANNILLFASGGVVSTLIASIDHGLPSVLASVFTASSLVGVWLLYFLKSNERSGGGA
ncbi:MFS transporter [Pseudomonas sp. P39-UII1]|uniref:MFS transporter n=1 Tax=Pseudomonas sp. P39-UII1 TaxID=3080333 RepID=UPI003207CD91